MRWMSTLVVGLLLAASPARGQSLPGPPTNVAAAITNDVLDVTWSAPTSGDAVLAYFVLITGPGLPTGGVAVPTPATALSLPMTGLPFGTYVITVVAANGAGQGPPSAAVSVTFGATALPSAPRNLVVSYVAGVLTVAWQPPASGAPITNYRLTAAGPGMPPGAVPVTGTSIAVAVPLATGLYAFAVSAVNAAGAGPFTPLVTLQVGPGSAPSAPLNFGVTYAQGVLTLAWQPPATGAPIAHYRVAAAGPGMLPGSTPVTGTSISVAIPLATGLYAFAVSAVNDVGEGPFTPVVNLQVGPSTVPSVPRNLAATVVNGLLTVSWDPPASGLPDYYRLFAVGPGAPGGATPVNGTSMTVPVGGAAAGTYLLAVSAVNAVGEGPQTAPIAVVLGPTGPPAAPKNLSATVTGGTLLVAWDPPDSGPPDSYTLRATGTAFNGVWALRLGGTTFSVDAAQLAPGVYTFTVSGENSRGEGPASAPVDVTVGPPCTAPSAPVLSGSANGGVASLSWTTPSGAVTGYTLHVAVAATGGVFTADLGLLTSIAGPLATGSYTFRVTARSSCGASPLSNGVTLVVP